MIQQQKTQNVNSLNTKKKEQIRTMTSITSFNLDCNKTPSLRGEPDEETKFWSDQIERKR